MPSYNFTLGKIIINCECEQCGKPFSYEQKIETSISSRYMPRPLPQEVDKAAKTLDEKARKILDTKKGLVVRKCPHCKQYQSWMKEGRQASLALNIAFVPGLLAAFITGMITYTNSIKGNNAVTTGLIEGIFLGIVALFLITAVFNQLARPIVRKYYNPKTNLKPEQVKEPALDWVVLNQVTGH